MASVFQRTLQRLEQEAALGRERIRIAQDMHDDLGASLSKIALLSEVTLQNLNQPELAQAQMEKIVGIAGHATENMSELVWATNPKFDTRESLVAYLREYAARHFEGAAVRAELDFPSEVRRFGNGLANMRQRIADLDGAFELQTKPGQGTKICVTARVPQNG